MKSHRSAADAPSAAQQNPWAFLFATPEFWKLIAAFLNAPRSHPHCLECTETELRNVKGFAKLLRCSTDLAVRDDGECRCRRCGHKLDVPQTVFTRLAEQAALHWRQWDHGALTKELIHREATLKVELAEITQYRNGMSPRTKKMHLAQMVGQLAACSGHPGDTRYEDTPTETF